MFESFLKRLLLLWGAFFVFEFTYANADFKTEKPIDRIKSLYESESARIGKKDPNPQLTKSRLEKFARGLTNEELEWLGRRAMQPDLSGDERVFSVFLLALNSSDLATAKLRVIAFQAKKLTAADKEVRDQAIKGLGKSKNPKSREALLEIETDQDDASLQNQAHRALYEFENGKPEPKPILKSHKKK